MVRLRNLEKALGKIFKAPAKKKPDSFSHSRRAAKELAEKHRIEIEKLDGGGFNVWAPSPIADTPMDIYDGDHYAADWREVHAMVSEYVRILEGEGDGASQ